MGIGKMDFLGSVSICIFPSCCSFSTDPTVATLSGNPFSRTAFFLTLRVQLQKFYFKNSVHKASFCVWAKSRAGRSSWLVWVDKDGERRQRPNSVRSWWTSTRLFVCFLTWPEFMHWNILLLLGNLRQGRISGSDNQPENRRLDPGLQET